MLLYFFFVFLWKLLFNKSKEFMKREVLLKLFFARRNPTPTVTDILMCHFLIQSNVKFNAYPIFPLLHFQSIWQNCRIIRKCCKNCKKKFCWNTNCYLIQFKIFNRLFYMKLLFCKIWLRRPLWIYELEWFSNYFREKFTAYFVCTIFYRK